MVAAREYSPRFTPDEYFAWEEQQEFKHEYIDGEVYAMSGGTTNHSEIASNFNFLLKAHLRGGNCRVLNSDARVSIQASNNYVYPDVSVTCDERDRNNAQFISNPCLIVEVLSSSTEGYDRGKKFEMYRRSSSLRDYVLVSTERVAIDLFRKDDRGEWKFISYAPGDMVELESINLTFPIEQLFEGIVFEAISDN
jgi:Uma2 family endonuclease